MRKNGKAAEPETIPTLYDESIAPDAIGAELYAAYSEGRSPQHPAAQTARDWERVPTMPRMIPMSKDRWPEFSIARPRADTEILFAKFGHRQQAAKWLPVARFDVIDVGAGQRQRRARRYLANLDANMLAALELSHGREFSEGSPTLDSEKVEPQDVAVIYKPGAGWWTCKAKYRDLWLLVAKVRGPLRVQHATTSMSRQIAKNTSQGYPDLAIY